MYFLKRRSIIRLFDGCVLIAANENVYDFFFFFFDTVSVTVYREMNDVYFR